MDPWGSSSTKHFFNLTPAHILDAVERLGYRCTGRCLALNSMENRVYEVEIELDHPPKLLSERFLIVKFYRPGRWSWDQIQDEHDFLLDLADADIPVVAPVQMQTGESVFHEPSLDLYYALFPKIGGRSPDELDLETCTRAGRLLARLHLVGRTKPSEYRIHLTPDSYGIQNLKWLVDHKKIPLAYEQRYKSIVEEICQTATPWFQETLSQRIHGDCHLGNLLLGPQGLFWVDFDDMVVGPPVQDLWLMVPGRDGDSQRRFQAILEGYETMAPFDRKSLRLVEPLRALRFVHFAAWIGRRWDDPSFPKSFPQYGSDRWWAEQMMDLQDQMELIRRV